MEGNNNHRFVFSRSFLPPKPYSLSLFALVHNHTLSPLQFEILLLNPLFPHLILLIPRGQSPISPEKWRPQHNHFRMYAVSFGALVTLQELSSGSSHFKQGASLRVTGKLQEYNVETAIAILIDGGATLKIDTQHLRLNFRVGSIYQFIGELHIQPDNEGVLKARVGRNVDGMDLNLYHQSLQLLREFQADQSHL